MRISKDELKYPLPIFDNDDYCLTLNDNKTATLIHHEDVNKHETIVDLSVLSKASLLSAYINDKQLLYSFIINVNNTNIYNIEMGKLLERIIEIDREMVSLNTDQDEMLDRMKISYFKKRRRIKL